MNQPSTVFDHLLVAIDAAASYNPNDAVAPAVVLWPDKAAAFEPLLPRLREHLPVFTLGAYDPGHWTGPVIWLRCIVDRALPEPEVRDGPPILYLPGVSRQELRAVEACPKELQPLLELQYRGTFFSQKSARDCTPASLLQGYLNIRVREDRATREALDRALARIADEPVAQLAADAPIDAGYLNNLLNPDPDRRVLEWMNDPEGEQKRMEAEGAGTWPAFRGIGKKTFSFDPVSDGPVTAAERLMGRQGAWATVWDRFVEAPRRYPNLPALLRRPQTHLFEASEARPQHNDDEEERLRQGLLAIKGRTVAEARAAVEQLENEHATRRTWVWSTLGMAPLANALEPLSALLEATTVPIGAGTPHEIAERYTDAGWRADAAALDALAAVSGQAHVDAVSIAVDALYRPWIEVGAHSFQRAVVDSGLARPSVNSEPKAGRCILFTDGLRFDVGTRLQARLQARDLDPSTAWTFGGLPGVTATAKPAISPIADDLGPGPEFHASVGGTTVVIGVLRRELEGAGFQILQGNDLGNPDGAAWTEYGNLDALGHSEGWRLSHRVDAELDALTERIEGLLEAGWNEVEVITDHGWLLLPGGLPKVELQQHLTEARKGRCARLKEGAQVEYATVPWHFDADVRIAIAPGVGTFVAGKEYEHGGLSVQECVLPKLTVRKAAGASTTSVSVAEASWVGLRYRVTLSDAPAGSRVDLRTKAADPASSVVSGGESREVAASGKASLLVPDEDREGEAVHLIVLDAEGAILLQQVTTVGSET